MIWFETTLGLMRWVSPTLRCLRIAAPAAITSPLSSWWTSMSPTAGSTTCTAGVARVALRATSVTRLMSMPGAISTHNDA